MRPAIKLSRKQLRSQCDSKQFDFKTTEELDDLTEILGHQRALEAIHFGVKISSNGYNLYALGSSGVGKYSVIQQILAKEAKQRSVPDDWCYIYNFEESQKPIAIHLPPGKGTELQSDMRELIEELSSSIPAILESDEFRTRIQEIEDKFKKRHEKKFKKIEEEAKKEGLLILSSPHGFTVVPAKEGKAVTLKEFEQLPSEERKEKEKKIEKFRVRLTKFIEKLPRLNREKRKEQKEVQREFIMSVVGYLIFHLKKKYADYEVVVHYLDQVEKDIIENAHNFIRREEATPVLGGVTLTEKNPLLRYEVNVIVSHAESKGAPIIYEANPVYVNLIGRVEYMSQLGALVTNFTLIRAGALHRANGGYLILDVMKLLRHPYAWDGLKRALYAGAITIETLYQALGLMSTVTIEPEPVPLNVKVVLIGERFVYYLLCALDPDFQKLFKVAADFEEEIKRDKNSQQLFARLIATVVRKEKLHHFDVQAVAAVINQSSRLAGDSEKLSVHICNVKDLLCEASYYADTAGRHVVGESEVEQAIKNQIWRADRIREQLYEKIERGTLLIDTEDQKVGQANGLSVIQLGGFSFGYPMRITATTRLGRGRVINIEREVKLSGAIHSKGVLILSGFLNGRYVQDRHLSLSASLVFEQSYGFVEGDSASVAELATLLSSLSNVPIKQSLAVTGSVNQHGQVQAVGGVNEKIEGFFAVCQQQGLTGEQGVIIPAANVKYLMLRQDVVLAVEKEKFHIYPVNTVDETITLLTGVSAGEKNRQGNFPRGSINYRVEQQLIEYAELALEEKRRKIKKIGKVKGRAKRKKRK